MWDSSNPESNMSKSGKMSSTERTEINTNSNENAQTWIVILSSMQSSWASTSETILMPKLA